MGKNVSPIFLMNFPWIYALSPPDPDFIGMANSVLGGLVKSMKLFFQFSGHPFIIGIQKRNPFTPGFGYSPVSGFAYPPVFLKEIGYLGEFRPYHFLCAIR